MANTMRNVGATVAGFVAASAVMMAVEFANGHVFYPALGKAAEGVTDRDVIRALLVSAPIGALLVVLAGWTLGGVAGGFTTQKLANGSTRPALVLALLLAAAGVLNNLGLPPPAWFWIGVPVLFVATLAGARLAR